MLHAASVPLRTPTVREITLPHVHAIEWASGHVWEISGIATATSLLIKQHCCSHHAFFSFPITWQVRLIWSVNVIQHLLVKKVALSSWCIVQASVSSNILLSMFNSSHHSVHMDLVLFPVLVWIQHKHGEQQRQQKITSLCSQLWSSSRQHSALVQGRSRARGLKLELSGATKDGVVHGASCNKYNFFYNPKLYLHTDITGVSTKIVPILFWNTLLDINI